MKIPRFAVAIALLVSTALLAQGKYDRSRGQTMLRSIKDEIRKHYYDHSYRGIDLDAHFAAAEKQVGEATSNSQIFGIIAQTLLEFDDSHLFFQPPPRASRVEYGWRYQSIGDRCYVTAVKPGSDAHAKGLATGDLILTIDGFAPARDAAWKLRYLYGSLRPRPVVRMIVQSPDGKQRQLDIQSEVTEGRQRVDLTQDHDFWTLVRDQEKDEHLQRHRYSVVDDVFIWKMPQFDLDDHEIRTMMKKASRHKALILDLRGNHGGLVTTLQTLAGAFFDHDVKIADVRSRKDDKDLTAKSWKGATFKGPVVVLIDSDSASSSEVLARLVQLEKRGTVIGDRSAGAVMQSRQIALQLGADVIIPYGLSVTDADLVMSDGKSLEKTGVTPDELILPSAKDLAAGHDPVLARAAKLVSVEMDAAKAGSLFPIEWKK